MDLQSKNLNTKFESVILSKIDNSGNIISLHSKSLDLELFHQIPDSIIQFNEIG